MHGATIKKIILDFFFKLPGSITTVETGINLPTALRNGLQSIPET